MLELSNVCLVHLDEQNYVKDVTTLLYNSVQADKYLCLSNQVSGGHVNFYSFELYNVNNDNILGTGEKDI